MAASKPEIVFVHGGWHTPDAYAKLRSQLESRGLTVHMPVLPTMNGTRPPTADLYTDSEAIRKYVTELVDAGRSIVAVMHSYGGQVGTNALVGLGAEARKQQGLPGGITRLVYIAGAANSVGQSMTTLMEKFGRMHMLDIAFDFADDGTCVMRQPAGIVGPGLSDDELANYLAGLKRWNGMALSQPLKECAWKDIPVSYIHTTENDFTTPIHYQQAMVEAIRSAGHKVQTFELATGHCPNITKPEELATILDQIVTEVSA
ncbi:hypothetical protein N7528_008614 [Penicillium herquei]|nr:hypothetical protein N7528_008614 [Penicillium herquei]